MVCETSKGLWTARLFTLRNAVIVLLLGSSVGGRGSAADVDFTRAVRPILVAKCQKCHGAEKNKGGLRFDTREGLLALGDSGAASVVPGQSAKSELLRRVSSKDALERMPPSGAPLSMAEIDTIRKWIDAGATVPKEGAAPAASGTRELIITEEDRRHWSFRPLTKVEPPRIKGDTWARVPIDRFVFAGLDGKKLSPTSPADPRVLIRRVTFDLTGLPPTPEEVEEFVRAKDPEVAYEALVDRLLASSHYGERWGRHWLDVARYADSGGYEGDHDRPTAYHYRDFVIRALNKDMPFDDFVRRQLAGDELQPDDPGTVAATGFLAAGPAEIYPETLLEEERTRLRYNELDDMVSTTGAALLGLTVGCARCHDHKFDPIPTRDYYRLLAGLHSGNRAEVPLGTRAEVEQSTRIRAEWDKKRKQMEDDLKRWLDEQRMSQEPRLRAAKIDKLPITEGEKALLRERPNSPEAKAVAKIHERKIAVTDAEVKNAADDKARRLGDELAARLADLKKAQPKAIPSALAFRDLGPNPVASWLFRRGDFHDRTIPVDLGFLTVLTGRKAAADYWKEARTEGDRGDTTYQRRALASWITDTDNGAGPLLARVIVNRIWQHHFGEGLVRTPNDFGVRGDRPTHPELLEWLTNDLVAHGWKLKRVHRMILLSAVYRQASTLDPEKAKVDPDNRFLWRMSPQRLEAEVLRDSLLAVGGTLNKEMFGPAFKAPIPADAMVARNVKNPYPTNIPDTDAVRRRSVYMFHKRVVPYPLLQAFDAPDAQQCSGQRANTTVVPQALALLNDPFVRSRASDFAARLWKESGENLTGCVERTYRLAFSRAPTQAEQTAGIEFLKAQERDRSSRQPKAESAEIRGQALTDYCQALFGLNEFLYID